MMRPGLIAGSACILASLLLGQWHGASAQSEPSQTAQKDCLEFVAGRPDTPPGAPMLINKCTGHTFVLVTKQPAGPRGAKHVHYFWQRIPMREPPSDLASARPAAGSKCFAYENRLFCE
jgi:hypothetical protein